MISALEKNKARNDRKEMRREEGEGKLQFKIPWPHWYALWAKTWRKARRYHHAYLGKRIPGRCQVPKSWSSYVSGCHSGWSRMTRGASDDSWVEMKMRPDPAGALGAWKGFLCGFLWARWGITAGFKQRSLQSKKNNGSGQSPGPLSHNWFC